MKPIVTLILACICQLGYTQTKRVIFVCEHGAAKSVIAATYFNKMAKERNLNWEAVCRGTHPDANISDAARNGLSADSLSVGNLRPQKLVLRDTADVERIIVFTPLPEDFNTNIEVKNWSHVPNIDASYEARRDAIIRQINKLLDSIEKEQKKK
jgi:arsenate reductase (thioredoxin)